MIVDAGPYVALLPAGGGDSVPTSIESSALLGVIGERLLHVDKDGAVVATLPPGTKVGPDVPLEKTLDLELAREVTIESPGASAVLVGQTRGGFAMFRTDGLAVHRLASANVRPASVVELDHRLAMLAINDTDADGNFNAIDESDLCFVDNLQADVPLDLPARTVPQRYVELATKLRAIGDAAKLARAQIRIWDAKPSDPLLVTFRARSDGPSDLGALRELARELQASVDKLGGDRVMTASVMFENGWRGEMRWSASTKQHRAQAGIGFALLDDPSEYTIALDPKVTTTLDESELGARKHIGPATCSGTIANLTDTAIANLEIACAGTGDDGKPKSRSQRLGKLGPHLGATYSITVPAIDGNEDIDAVPSLNGQPVVYLNRYAQTQHAAILELAKTVLAQTHMQVVRTSLEAQSTYRDDDKFRLVVLKVGPEFADAGTAKQETITEQVVELVKKFDQQQEPKQKTPRLVGLRLLEHDRQTTGWVYWAGKLQRQRR